MSQDFLSSGMARAHGYESIFAPHAVRGRPRVFEPLQANSPFLDVLACTQTVRKMFKSWGNGDAAPSSGDIGDTAAVVIAGRKSLLTQREKGADKHFFGGGACGDSTLRRGKVCLRHWVASRVGDGGSRACHRGVANRVTRGSLLLLGQTDTFKTAALAPAQESQLACAALKNRALSHRCKCVVRIRHPLGSLCSIHLECLSVYTILGQWAPALRAVGEAKQDPMAFSVVAEGRPGHPPGCRTGESRDVVVSRRIAGCQLRRLDNSSGGSPHGMDRILEKLPHPDRAVDRLLFLCEDRNYSRSVDPTSEDLEAAECHQNLTHQ